MESSINLLRGKIYEAMENRTLAMECFFEALRQDVYCYEAFELLVNHHMLSAQEGEVFSLFSREKLAFTRMIYQIHTCVDLSKKTKS